MQPEGEGGVVVRQSFKKRLMEIWWDLNLGTSDNWFCTLLLDHQDMWRNKILDRYLMDCNSAQNNSSATAEIEWRISQIYSDDICLPLCILFIIWTHPTTPPNSFYSWIMPNIRMITYLMFSFSVIFYSTLCLYLFRDITDVTNMEDGRDGVEAVA